MQTRYREFRVYVLLVSLTAVQLGALVLSGALSHVSTKGTGLMVVMLVALGARSRIARTLLIVVNGLPLIAVAALPLIAIFSGSSHLMWGHVAIMLVTGVAVELTLCSAAMRDFVRVDRPRQSLIHFS